MTARSHIEFRVWWFPQLGGPMFTQHAPDLAAVRLLCSTLTEYDKFLTAHGIKPDRENAGGAMWRHPILTGGEWVGFDPENEDDRADIGASLARLKRAG